MNSKVIEDDPNIPKSCQVSDPWGAEKEHDRRLLDVHHLSLEMQRTVQGLQNEDGSRMRPDGVECDLYIRTIDPKMLLKPAPYGQSWAYPLQYLSDLHDLHVAVECYMKREDSRKQLGRETEAGRSHDTITSPLT
jgi:hypothetical protein